MTKRHPIPVTDHAVLRWLERSGLVDIAAVRISIGLVGAIGIAHGAKYVVHGRVKLVIADGRVVTVLAREMLESRVEATAIADEVVSLQGLAKMRKRGRRRR